MKLFYLIHSLFILIFYLGASKLFSQHAPESCNKIYELKNESFKNKVFLELEKYLFEIVSNSKPSCNLKIVFKDGISHISRKANDSKIYLQFSKNKSETILEGNKDLLYLLSFKGFINNKIRFPNLGNINSLEDLLSAALEELGNDFKKIKSPNGEDWFGGNPNAQNSYNGGNFNYAVIEQLHSDDKVKGIVSRWKKHPEWRLELDGGKSHIDAKYLPYFNFSEGNIPGLECAAATAMHMYKSLGLVRPDMTRLELEETYTELHRKSQQRNGIIPAKYNNALRGMDGFSVSSQMYADWANILKESDWAKLTGAYRIQKYKFKFISSREISIILNEERKVVLATLNKKGGFSGHIYLITNVGKDELRVDESFEWQPAKKVNWIKDGYSSLLVLEGTERKID